MVVISSGAVAQASKEPALKVIEKVSFDWSHSGKPTRFTLLGANLDGEFGGASRLEILTGQGRRQTFKIQDDVWGKIETPGLKRQNLVPSAKRMVFVAEGKAPDARTYLILIGIGDSCCDGAVDVLTVGSNGWALSVFHAKEQFLHDVVSLGEGRGIELVGQSGGSEARALKNAQSYDPFRVYLIAGEGLAQYSLELSKAYTEEHYCQWHGPKYDERFVAVGPVTGAKNCRVMTNAKFFEI